MFFTIVDESEQNYVEGETAVPAYGLVIANGAAATNRLVSVT